MAFWCIDDGHGGVDVGAINGSRYEKNDVAVMGKKVRALLEFNGEKVVATRNGDSNPSLSDRCAIANNNGVDYFLSIHRNSSTNISANGLETFCYPGSAKGKVFATYIQNSLLESVSFTNRGVKEANFQVLRDTNMTACLVELGFIVNSKDNSIYDSNVDVIAEQIVKGCLQMIGKSFKKPQPITPPPTGAKTMFRVVCGSFKDKDNAQSRLNAVQTVTGFNCFLVAEVIEGVTMYRVVCGSFENRNNAQNRAYEVYEKTKFDCFLIAVKV